MEILFFKKVAYGQEKTLAKPCQKECDVTKLPKAACRISHGTGLNAKTLCILYKIHGNPQAELKIQ